MLRIYRDMKVKSEIEVAIELATKFHKGQVDKQGEEYILHPLRVMLGVNNKSLMVVAVLHDILEDTECTEEVLRNSRISESNIEKIVKLSKGSDEKYFDYINRLRNDELCTAVKIVDLKDNLRDGCTDTLKKRYEKALNILQNNIQ